MCQRVMDGITYKFAIEDAPNPSSEDTVRWEVEKMSWLVHRALM